MFLIDFLKRIVTRNKLRLVKIPNREVFGLIFFLEEVSDNPRYKIDNLFKYWFQDDLNWYGLYCGRQCLAMAVLCSSYIGGDKHRKVPDFSTLLEIQCVKKGFGHILLNMLIERLKNVYWQVNPKAKKTLFEYYKKIVPEGTVVVEKNWKKHFICGENEETVEKIKRSLFPKKKNKKKKPKAKNASECKKQ